MRLLWLFCLVSAPLAASASDCLPLRVGNPEGNYIVPGVRGRIVYRRVDGAEIALDAYVQRKGGARPAVVVIHGGGWSAGSRVAFVGQLLETLTGAGFNWFSIDYRLGGLARRMDALDDLRAAVTFIRCHAKELRIDPERIAVLGEDTGAQLAVLLSAEKPPGVRAAALIGGLYDPTNSTPGRGAPDLLVIHGNADSEVRPEQASAFCDAVRAGGGRCDFIPVEQGIHRTENWRPSQWGYKARLVEWLQARLGLARPDHEPHVGGRLQKGIVYETRHGLRLDSYVPPGRGPFPGVIVVHGGGWEAGDRVTYVTPVFEPLARAGFAWFSIDYRLTPDVRHPQQLEDLRAAVAFVRGNARRFRVDPKRLALLGESASGQMVAQVATEDSELAAVVSFYGVYDFLPMVSDAEPRSLLVRLFGIQTLDDEARAVLRRYSPVHHVSKGMPPLLLIHGTSERLWAQGLAMRDRLAAAGVPHELYGVDGAPHGMENWEGRPEWTGYKQKLVDWLGERFRR